MANKAYRVEGTIHRARFVKLDTSADNTVSAAGANAVVFGISQLGGDLAPLPSNSQTTEAATDGNQVNVESIEGEVRLLEFGDTVVRGDRLKSDADGKGVPIAGSGGNQNVGAIAMQSGAAGTLGNVMIRKESVYVA